MAKINNNGYLVVKRGCGRNKYDEQGRYVFIVKSKYANVGFFSIGKSGGVYTPKELIGKRVMLKIVEL